MKNSAKLIILASCEAVSPLKDGGWSIRFHTNEPNRSQIESLLSNHNQFGMLYFQGGKEVIDTDVMKELDSVDIDLYDKRKSQSQRLRNVLYRWFEQTELQGYENEDLRRELWRDFYRAQTEKLINHFKNKLEP